MIAALIYPFDYNHKKLHWRLQGMHQAVMRRQHWTWTPSTR